MFLAKFQRLSLRIRIVLSVACWFCLQAVLGAGQDQAGSTAADALRKGHYAEAILLSDKALQTDPGNCRILTLRGLALQGTQKQVEAIESFKAAVSHCPTFLPALEALAQSEYVSNDPDANRTLSSILAIVPNEPTANAMLGAFSYKEGDCTKAVKYFTKGGAAVEQDGAASREFGICLLIAGESRKAEDLLKTLLDHDGSAPNRLLFAYAAWKNKDDSVALQSLQPLLSNDTRNAKALTLAAQIGEDIGDTPHATQWLREAILADPKNAGNYLFFASLAFNHGSYTVGIDVLNAGIQELPDDARLYLARGVLSVQVSEIESAIRDFRRAHELDPKMSFVLDAMALLQEQKHEPEAALAILREQVLQHPSDPLLQYLYAEALSEESDGNSKGKMALAIEAAEQSLKLEPDYQPARDLLCRLYLEVNNLDAAVLQAEEALRRNEDDDVALYQGMVAYRRMGRRDKAEAFVARLKGVRERQQSKRIKYLLTEGDPSPP